MTNKPEDTEPIVSLSSLPSRNIFIEGLGLGLDRGVVGSGIGSRNEKKQEDNFWPRTPDGRNGAARYHQLDYLVAGRLYIVADGVSGGLSGDIASDLAVHTIAQTYYKNALQSLEPTQEELQRYLVDATIEANRVLLDESRRLRQERGVADRKSYLQAAVICALLRGQTLLIARVGDCRLYRFRDGEVDLLSESELATRHSFLGTNLQRDGVVVSLYDLKPSDVLILCSDGLYKYVAPLNDPERAGNVIADTFNTYYQSGGIEKVRTELLNKADDERTGGGGDNITIMLVQPPGLDRPSAASEALESLLERAWWLPVEQDDSDSKQLPTYLELNNYCKKEAGEAWDDSERQVWGRRASQFAALGDVESSELEKVQVLYKRLDVNFAENEEIVRAILDHYDKAPGDPDVRILALRALVDLANTALLSAKEDKGEELWATIRLLHPRRYDLFQDKNLLQGEDGFDPQTVHKQLWTALTKAPLIATTVGSTSKGQLQGLVAQHADQLLGLSYAELPGKLKQLLWVEEISETPKKTSTDNQSFLPHNALASSKVTHEATEPLLQQKAPNSSEPSTQDSKTAPYSGRDSKYSVSTWNPDKADEHSAIAETQSPKPKVTAEPFASRFKVPLLTLVIAAVALIAVIVASRIMRDRDSTPPEQVGSGPTSIANNAGGITDGTMGMRTPTSSLESGAAIVATETPSVTASPTPSASATLTATATATVATATTVVRATVVEPVLSIRQSTTDVIDTEEGVRRQFTLTTNVRLGPTSALTDTNSVIVVETRLPDGLTPSGSGSPRVERTTEPSNGEVLVTQEIRLRDSDPQNLPPFQSHYIIEPPHGREPSYPIVVTARLIDSNGNILFEAPKPVEVEPLPYEPALSITQVISEGLYTINDSVLFSLTITNTGQTYIESLRLNNDSSALEGLQSADNWLAQFSELGPLEPGEVQTITLETQVSTERPGVITPTLPIEGLLGDSSVIVANISPVQSIRIYAAGLTVDPEPNVSDSFRYVPLRRSPGRGSPENTELAQLPFGIEVKVLGARRADDNTWWLVEATDSNGITQVGYVWNARVDLTSDDSTLREYIDGLADLE